MTSIVAAQDLWQEISKGKIPGRVVEYLGIGFNLNRHSTLGLEVVWNRNTIYPISPAATQVMLVSNSPSDTFLGIGARQIIVHGTNSANDAFIEETLNLSGTTPVFTVNSFRSVSGLSRVATAGSVGGPDGLITGSIGGSIVLSIDKGFNEGSHSFLRIPTDTTGFLFGINYTSRFRCEFITQKRIAVSGASFNDLDRADVSKNYNLELDRTPFKLDPGDIIRTVMRSQMYFNKVRVSWRLALIPTNVL